MFCCPQREFSDFSRAVDTAAIELKLPYMCSLELTYRCNQSCLHCYCNLPLGDARGGEEMPTDEVTRLIDEAADAGCLWLLLTGGEVLLRGDFPRIYLHAVRKGMLVEVFTNATLLGEEHAGLFAEFPPLGIDISIYGADAATHDAVTGLPGSFARTMEGIGRLQSRQVKFSLKTILMSLNKESLGGMRRLAASLGASFRYDTLICPRNDGDMGPARYRLPADTMADFDLEEDPAACERIFAGFWDRKPTEELTCGGGIFAFNINPYGVLSPCTMFRSFQYPLKGVSFSGEWERLKKEYEARKREFTDPECRGCSMRLICSSCPAWSELESRGLGRKVDYTCAYARSLEKKFLERYGNPHKEVRSHGEKTVP